MSLLSLTPSTPLALEGEPDAEVARVRAARVRVGGWALALILGFIMAWRSRHDMNPDGVSYLDVADAYLAGDWPAAINATWSPLFSWVVAAATFVTRPSAYHEFTVVHVVNFLIYALSLVTFELLLTELIRPRPNPDLPGAPRLTRDDESVWRLLGYSVFMWSGLEMIGLEQVTPDMCVAALVYLAAALLLKLRDPRASSWLAVGLGITLGFSYLAKAAMFPLAFVFMVSGLAAWRVPRSVAVQRALVMAAGFGIVALPYIVALSVKQGYPTWGSVSKLAYAWCIDGATETVHCGAGAERSVVHETRQVWREPDVYAFASPIAGTYPPFYDPSYWFSHVRSRFKPFRMIGRAVDSGLKYLRWLGPLIAAFGVALAVSTRTSSVGRGVREHAPLTLPAVAALLLYAPVYVESRYIGPFAVLLSLAAFVGLRGAQPGVRRLLMEGVTISLFVVLMTRLIVSALFTALTFAQRPDLTAPSAHVQWQVANALGAMGVQPGDGVAVMGSEIAPYWARLARVRVVAQIPTTRDVNTFWGADAPARDRVTHVLAQTGARAVVTKEVPSWTRSDTWRPLGRTTYRALILTR